MAEGIHRKPIALFEFLSMEEQQLLTSLAINREELGVIAQIEGLYEAAMSKVNVRENDLVIFQLLTLTHYHFLYATASQLRCHLAEAFASARIAIDAALIASWIIHDRGSQVAYANRESPFDKFPRHLSNLVREGKPLPHRLVPHLLDQFGKISSFANHADIRTFLHRVEQNNQQDNQQDNQVLMSFHYFQFARNEAERKLHAFTLFHTGVMVLDVFADFLVDEQKVVPDGWKQHLHKLGRELERRAEALRGELPAQ